MPQRSGRKVSTDKCLGCHDHKDLRAKIRAGEGYHAKPKLKNKPCENCHLEHKGRSYNLMGWKAVGGMKNFNHRDADWVLNGKHATVACKDCHKRKNRQGLRIFLGEDRLCGSCHKNDQPHGFTEARPAQVRTVPQRESVEAGQEEPGPGL